MLTIANTDQIEVMARDGIRRQANRAVKPAFFERLDQGGVHVLQWSMLHADGAEVRGLWLCKFKDDDQPHRLWLDVQVKVFNANTQTVET